MFSIACGALARWRSQNFESPQVKCFSSASWIGYESEMACSTSLHYKYSQPSSSCHHLCYNTPHHHQPWGETEGEQRHTAGFDLFKQPQEAPLGLLSYPPFGHCYMPSSHPNPPPPSPRTASKQGASSAKEQNIRPAYGHHGRQLRTPTTRKKSRPV